MGVFPKRFSTYKNPTDKSPIDSGKYWNGDDWGSNSGYKEAREWTKDQLTDYVLKNAQPRK